METKSLLEDKRILIVDDEPDVLDTLEDLLTMCKVVKAGTFDDAKELLQTQHFDMAILDIMGVAGFKLLEIANRKDVMAVMLTSHGLSPDNIVRSYRNGAASYIPKEKIVDIEVFLNDVLEAKGKGKSHWWRWFGRLAALFEKKFGRDWQDHDKEFWKKFPKQ